MLSRSSAIVVQLDEYRRWKTQKCSYAAILKILPVTSTRTESLSSEDGNVNKNNRLNYKIIDLITEYNHFMWECNYLAHQSL